MSTRGVEAAEFEQMVEAEITEVLRLVNTIGYEATIRRLEYDAEFEALKRKAA